MNTLLGSFSLITEGKVGERKITGTKLSIDRSTEKYDLYFPVSSWSPSPILFLDVGRNYKVQVKSHKDRTLSLIKLEGSRLAFVKV